MHEFASSVGKVLDSGRRVMVYSGKEDYICNYLGGGGMKERGRERRMGERGIKEGHNSDYSL